jgi:hypothetical protein
MLRRIAPLVAVGLTAAILGAIITIALVVPGVAAGGGGRQDWQYLTISPAVYSPYSDNQCDESSAADVLCWQQKAETAAASYEELHVPSGQIDEGISPFVLDVLGADGWELIAYTQVPYAYNTVAYAILRRPR